MPINSYIENIAKHHTRGIATEHTFRGDLQRLIEELVPEVAATNEPKRIECGAPDYVLTRKDIPVGYIEAKDIGKDLDAKEFKEQFDRYRNALDNLIITDNLDFRFYINGKATASIRIGEIRNGGIVALPETFDQFASLIKEFCSRTPQTIKSSKRLAEMMAEKAKILAFIIKNALEEDIAAEAESDLTNQMKAFKDILIHDIDPKAFADIYAQTIAYGMFAARLHDDTLDTFSRQEAANKIPKTNPFLRKLFQFIAAFDLDTRIDWIVDALADLFRATDIAEILKNFGKSTQTHDPIMHFYETFLAEYDPKLRKSRGVFYTPEPVVDFIVRAVDHILKTEFNLPNGIADTSKVKVKVKTPVVKKGQGTVYEEVDNEYHKVQILDPATGTGTFLATVIKHIYKGFENQQGVWSQYVDEHLIPRLNGFELLMASYAMAHLKLDLLLSETGYKPATSNANDQRRFQVYLTNALEEYHPDTGTLFASWLSTEANEANHIKRDTPVMVVIGNPPYSGISSNMGKWISDLIEQYKYVDGEHFGERKHWLHDDYVKFIRLGQYFVDKNGDGILAFINNHSFLDNPTFRGMRWNLLNSFDDIYVIDLHGNSKKTETSPNGVVDQNVFDIQAGVSINIFVKRTASQQAKKLATVKHIDAWGKREAKYDLLLENSLSELKFATIDPHAPYYFFRPKNFSGESLYNEGFKIGELFRTNVTGIVTARDFLVVDFDESTLLKKIEKFCDITLADNQIRAWLFPNKKEGKYEAGDTRGWQISNARKKIQRNNHKAFVKDVAYRPFDTRKIYYSPDMVDWGREKYMKHLDNRDNLALMTCRQSAIDSWEHVGVTNLITDDCRVSNRSRERGYIFPLYLYPDDIAQRTLDGRTHRTPNLNPEVIQQFSDGVGLAFVPEKTVDSKIDGSFAPIDILDYIYAVLHSPSYREKYKEFLKIDFPRVPYPRDAATFWQLVALGGELRQIHLLESATVSKFITSFNVGGDNVVEKIAFVPGSPPYEGGVADASSDGVVLSDARDLSSSNVSENHPPATAVPLLRKEGSFGDVYFNDTQYFAGVPEIAWNFYIGGYQPAQKWLKDRKGRKLSFDDIQHYQKIIVALTETDRIMTEIDRKNFIL
ncbi:MAG: hypothetical protein KA746_15775 [Pyrinomonadaceae bacterium]|nr:hypothetical protein [Pyrinomonadaceae bacterium]MBP6213385.1 hypothetical protein [Pyrinomonadaceae bacterium]